MKKIKGYGGYYVTETGRVYSTKKGKFKQLKAAVGSRGYPVVALYTGPNRQRKFRTVHRIVAEAFLPNPGNKPCVNHKNGSKDDNHVGNLEWCTYSENNKHAYDAGLKIAVVGSGKDNPNYKHGLTFDKDHIRSRSKEYREKNREEINRKQKEKRAKEREIKLK